MQLQLCSEAYITLRDVRPYDGDCERWDVFFNASTHDSTQHEPYIKPHARVVRACCHATPTPAGSMGASKTHSSSKSKHHSKDKDKKKSKSHKKEKHKKKDGALPRCMHLAAARLSVLRLTMPCRAPLR